MPNISRRDILSSFLSSLALAANPAHALTCDVSRSSIGDVSSKSYSCRLGEGRSLTTTFLRVSDLLADNAGQGLLPKALGEFEGLASGTYLIENEQLKTFQSLMDRYSYAFEAYVLSAKFDGRGTQGSVIASPFDDNLNNRYRTLGFWDESDSHTFPFFPLPDLLRRAFRDPNFHPEGFLRFADASDFENFDDRLAEYLGLWRSETGEEKERRLRWYTSKSLELLNHIGAGSVAGFLPLFFTSNLERGVCSDRFEGGGSYAPPALFIDITVSKNDGDLPISIDDFFGSSERGAGLRAYNSDTPQDSAPFGWGKIDLLPGESVVAVQRLLFTSQPVLNVLNQYNSDAGNELPILRSNRAVFGPTELPKGVIVDGREFPFDGRSHNALILASYAEGGCCPYLYFWCDIAQEWVSSGKVMVDHIGIEKIGEDTKKYGGLVARFKLIEHEHERTFLSGLTRVLSLKDGTKIKQKHADCEVILDIGQSHEVSFELPLAIDLADILTTSLVLNGYYEKYVVRRQPQHLAVLDNVK